MSFLAPYLGVLLYARYVDGWSWPQAQIAGISLSTTSVAVVYAVMVETGFNKTELGKIILAACFITDLGTVLALGVVFAHFDAWLALFGAATAVALWLLPRFAPWFFDKVGHRVSEPETKFVSLVLLSLGGMSQVAGSEAVLPAYLVGMALAPGVPEGPGAAASHAHHRLHHPDAVLLPQGRLARDLQHASVVGRSDPGLPGAQDGHQVRRHPAADAASTTSSRREGMYTTLLMSTGLTFGTISALFGLTNKIIDQQQYTILVTAVIGSAVVPTLIAQKWFMPAFKPMETRCSASEGGIQCLARS